MHAALIFLTLLFSMIAMPALADETTRVSFGPLLTEIAAAVGIALATAGLVLVQRAIRWLSARTGVDIQLSDEMVRRYLNEIIQKAIALVIDRLGPNVSVDVRNAAIARAAQYVVDSAPDALARFGIERDHLHDMIESRVKALFIYQGVPPQQPPLHPDEIEPAPV